MVLIITLLSLPVCFQGKKLLAKKKEKVLIISQEVLMLGQNSLFKACG